MSKFAITLSITKEEFNNKYRSIVGTNMYLGEDDSEWVFIEADDKYVKLGKASNKDTDLIQYFN
jgi:hypothetical protein